jgi:membrane protein
VSGGPAAGTLRGMTATRDPVGRPPDRSGASAGGRAPDRGLRAPGRAAAAVREAARPVTRQRHVSVLRRTLSRAWGDRILGLSAEAAFWQLLSLPPLFLALLGSLGYLSGLLGPETVNEIEQRLLEAFSRAFTPSVVDEVIAPTVNQVLREGRAEVISVGFLIGLWAGSSATATFVNTVTIAYGMRDLRGAIRSRLLALFLYLLTVLIGVVLLPVMVLGPGRLVGLFPQSVRGDVETAVNAAYWPTVAGLLLLGLVTFYHLAPPRRLPWLRGFPGAVLAGVVFLLGSIALRTYIGFIVGQGLTYGALAAPIGALLFFYVLALAVLLGAELNATIEQNRVARAVPMSPDGVLPAGSEPTGHPPAPDGRGPAADRAEQPRPAGRGPAADSADGTPGTDRPGPAGSA